MRWKVFFLLFLTSGVVKLLSQEVVYGEYFFNTDPGYGNGIAVSFTPTPDVTAINFSTSIATLQNGFNKLYFRVKDANGNWSLTNVNSFYKETVYTALPNIVKAEYFVDTDPGNGNGTNIAVTPSTDLTSLSFTADLTAFENGFHQLYTRVKDANGIWSLTNVNSFYKETVYIALQNIVKAEYFIDTDPGSGNGIKIAVTPAADLTSLSFTTDLTAFGNGFHQLYTRVKDANGIWSLTNVNSFYKETVYMALQNIVKAEYFIDTDPGLENGIDIPLSMGSDINNLQFIADVSGFLLGTHYLYVRTKDQNGKWSLSNVKSFDIDCALLEVNFSATEGSAGSPLHISDNSNNVYPLARYEWNFGDGSPEVITGKGDVEHTYDTGGVFDVQLIIHNSSECKDTITNPVTIKAVYTNNFEGFADKSIKAYPNPVKDELIIESFKNEKINFEIQNSIGQIMYQGIVFDKVIVKTSNFKSGMYVVKLGNGKICDFQKIIKM